MFHLTRNLIDTAFDNGIMFRIIKPIYLVQILKHLLALCDRMVSDDAAGDAAHAHATVVEQAHAMIAASISRELLKLGTSALEKSIAKEYVKILTTVQPSTWAAKFGVRFIIV